MKRLFFKQNNFCYPSPLGTILQVSLSNNPWFSSDTMRKELQKPCLEFQKHIRKTSKIEQERSYNDTKRDMFVELFVNPDRRQRILSFLAGKGEHYEY